MGEFRMPSLGADMDVGTIIEWLVQPGDPVTRGQIVAVVDTAKAAIEIEAFEAGVVQEILVPPGRQVPVGTPLALIGAGAPAGLAVATPAAAGAAARVGSPPPAARPAARTVSTHDRPDEVARAAPPVRHLAHQLGVDLGTIEATGPDGRITHDDVLRTAGPEQGNGGSARTAPVEGAAADGATPLAASAPAPQAPAASAPPGQHPEPPGRLRVTPRARRLAAERGIDLGAVAGTGAAGAVLSADLDRAAEAAAAGPGGGAAESAAAPTETGAGPRGAGFRPGAAPEVGTPGGAAPMQGAAGAGTDRKAAMRSAIAALMSRSNAEIPHYYVTQTLDLGPALAWLRAHNADLPVRQRLVPTVLFLRATALAAVAVPDLNGHWVDGALRPAERVDLGVAVATRGGGLVTPAIPDAGALGVDELMARLADLVARARRGTLKRAEMAGATITVSALGEDGPDTLYGVIFPPQVALVGVGSIVERPWAVDGMLTVRPTATVALAADHRASDGRTASAFLSAFAHALAHPEEL